MAGGGSSSSPLACHEARQHARRYLALALGASCAFDDERVDNAVTPVTPVAPDGEGCATIRPPDGEGCGTSFRTAPESRPARRSRRVGRTCRSAIDLGDSHSYWIVSRSCRKLGKHAYSLAVGTKLLLSRCCVLSSLNDDVQHFADLRIKILRFNERSKLVVVSLAEQIWKL